MSENLRHLMEHIPLIGGMMARASQAGNFDMKGLASAAAVGIVSALGSAQLTAAKLEERLAAIDRVQVEFRQEVRAKMAGMDNTDTDLRERMSRMEARAPTTIQPPYADRRPR